MWLRYTWGKGSAEARSTFSGFRSQWTMFLKCRCLSAARICTHIPTTTQTGYCKVQSNTLWTLCYDAFDTHQDAKIGGPQLHAARYQRVIRSTVNTHRMTTLFIILSSLARIHTCVMRNFVSLSGSLPFSLERIISSMSPWSFSITTNTFSGVSNIHSRFTMPRWRRLWEREERRAELGFYGRELVLKERYKE